MLFNINFRQATIDDLADLFFVSGFNNTSSDFKLAKEQDWFKFIGIEGGCARYLVGFHDDERDTHYVSIAFVRISTSECGFEVDWGGAPVFEHEDEDEVTNYIENHCN